MIDKKYIKKLASECLFGTDRFIVGINISIDNNIKVFIDSDSGIKISDCVELSRHIESSLDREDEDFELSVASAGVDHPFVLLRQYTNSIDNSVQVTDTDDKKIRGILKKADDESVEILPEIKIKNKKIKKVTYGDLITIPMKRIKETKRIVTF